jgi:hypothetical protein
MAVSRIIGGRDGLVESTAVLEVGDVSSLRTGLVDEDEGEGFECEAVADAELSIALAGRSRSFLATLSAVADGSVVVSSASMLCCVGRLGAISSGGTASTGSGSPSIFCLPHFSHFHSLDL